MGFHHNRPGNASGLGFTVDHGDMRPGLHLLHDREVLSFVPQHRDHDSQSLHDCFLDSPPQPQPQWNAVAWTALGFFERFFRLLSQLPREEVKEQWASEGKQGEKVKETRKSMTF